jgi:hypothetical protein
MKKPGIEFRYPGETALKEDAVRCFEIMEHTWVIIIKLLK